MVKSLLILALVTTQLLTWGAGPSYLCLCQDGGVCLDRGPDTCDCCCQHEAKDASDTAEGCGCACHQAPPSDDFSSSSVDPERCGCQHIQISDGSSPDQVPPRIAVHASDADLVVLPFSDLSAETSLVGTIGRPPGEQTAPLSVSASVVLRC